MSYYALPGILGTLMSQTVTLCPRLVFVSIVTLVFGNNECSPPEIELSRTGQYQVIPSYGCCLTSISSVPLVTSSVRPWVQSLLSTASATAAIFSGGVGGNPQKMAANSDTNPKRRKFMVPSLSAIRDEQDHGNVSKKVVLFGQQKEEEPAQQGKTNKATRSSRLRSGTGKAAAVASEDSNGVQRNVLLSRKLSQKAGIAQLHQQALTGAGRQALVPAQVGSKEHTTDVDPPSEDAEIEAASLHGTGEDDPESRPKAASTAAGTVVNQKPHAIVVNPVQRANSVMKYIVNVPWEVDDIVPDFILGRTTCAFFLRCVCVCVCVCVCFYFSCMLVAPISHAGSAFVIVCASAVYATTPSILTIFMSGWSD